MNVTRVTRQDSSAHASRGTACRAVTQLAKLSNVEQASMVAAKDIGTDENILVVEDKQWLNLDFVEKSRIGHAVVDEPGWVQLALLLTTEANNTASPWSSYFEDFRCKTSLPIVLWSKQELQELQGTQVLSTAMQYRYAHVR